MDSFLIVYKRSNRAGKLEISAAVTTGETEKR